MEKSRTRPGGDAIEVQDRTLTARRINDVTARRITCARQACRVRIRVASGPVVVFIEVSQALVFQQDPVFGHYAFDRWFDWSLHSVVIDLSEDPLLREEL